MLMRFSSEWKCWKNVDGVVTTIRRHLTGSHPEEYERVCNLLNLRHPDKPANALVNERAPFSLREWLRYLVKWIVVDDQVLVVQTRFCR